MQALKGVWVLKWVQEEGRGTQFFPGAPPSEGRGRSGDFHVLLPTDTALQIPLTAGELGAVHGVPSPTGCRDVPAPRQSKQVGSCSSLTALWGLPGPLNCSGAAGRGSGNTPGWKVGLGKRPGPELHWSRALGQGIFPEPRPLLRVLPKPGSCCIFQTGNRLWSTTLGPTRQWQNEERTEHGAQDPGKDVKHTCEPALRARAEPLGQGGIKGNFRVSPQARK